MDYEVKLILQHTALKRVMSRIYTQDGRVKFKD